MLGAGLDPDPERRAASGVLGSLERLVDSGQRRSREPTSATGSHFATFGDQRSPVRFGTAIAPRFP
jgi:hypothetical protein